MEQATCKCINSDCSTTMYGYGRAKTLIICFECKSLLVVNRIAGPISFSVVILAYMPRQRASRSPPITARLFGGGAILTRSG